MPSSLQNTPTSDANINGLMSSVRWDTTTLTYSFPASASFYEPNYGEEPTKNFAELNDTMKNASRQAFAMFSQVTNLTFSEITETATIHADMRSGYSQISATNLAHAYFPSPNPNAGDAWYNNGGTDNTNAIRGNNDFATVVHELGHALGLKHPHEADGTNFPILAAAYDFGDYSIMSYRSVVNGQLSALSNETFGYSHTPMMYDVAALQTMYGANYSWQSTNTTYSWSTSTGEMSINGAGQGAAGANRIFMNLWDGGGRDTYDLSNYTSALSIDLAPGGWSTFSQDQRAKLIADGSALATGNVSNALLSNGDLRSLIEDAIGGTAADVIRGNQGNNALQGRAGADQLSGLTGNDALLGDGTILPSDNAMSVRRLYLATLGRGPDDGGWANWTAELDGGKTLDQIIPGFLNSAEFTAKYGQLDNTAFVTALYRNVFFREPDTAGLNGWVSQLNGGNSRASVVLGFSESAEFRIASDPELHMGQTYRLYLATLAREPDQGGLLDWATQIDNGTSLNAVAAGFVNSAEFQQKYGSLNNTQFVQLLYQNVLGREPDQAGLNDWVGRLDSGATRTTVVLGFSESLEFVTSKTAGLINYMRTANAAWNDALDGGAGDDRVAGGLGGDTFIFNKTDLGTADHVLLWEAWDRVSFVGFGYADSAAAQSHMTQQGENVMFTDQGQSITFHSAKISEITIL